MKRSAVLLFVLLWTMTLLAGCAANTPEGPPPASPDTVTTAPAPSPDAPEGTEPPPPEAATPAQAAADTPPPVQESAESSAAQTQAAASETSAAVPSATPETPPSAAPADAPPEASGSAIPAPSPAEPPAPPAAGSSSVKTGMAFVTTLDQSTDAGSDNGFVQADSIVAAVTVDSDGRIVRCAIDLVRTIGEFTASGQIVTPLNAAFPSLNQQGGADARQLAAMAAYCVGKTAGEVREIAVDETGHAADAGLRTSVTIPVKGFINAVVKAANNAKDLGASADDKLGVGIETNITYSINAGPGQGSVLVYATFAAVTTDEGGVITSCAADAFQHGVAFDKTGRILSGLTPVSPTKNETGDSYGLKPLSAIGKEWYEQTAAFAEYVIGKTAAEIEGIAVRADTSPSSSDLRATVTLKIGEFKKVIAEAARFAA